MGEGVSCVVTSGNQTCVGDHSVYTVMNENAVHLKLNIKKKNGQRTQIDISPKKTYKCPTCA